MVFAQARDAESPPYLLDFCGTPGERHVENLKASNIVYPDISLVTILQILRDVGTTAYNKAAALVSGQDNAAFKRLESQILHLFVGPDCYWKNTDLHLNTGCFKHFGNAWWIPFPPTLVSELVRLCAEFLRTGP